MKLLKSILRFPKLAYRRAERFNFNRPVRIFVDSKNCDGILSNISESGALIKSHESFDVHGIVELAMEVEGEYERLKALVVREQEQELGMKGFGVQFQYQKKAEKRFVRNLIEKIQTDYQPHV